MNNYKNNATTRKTEHADIHLTKKYLAGYMEEYERRYSQTVFERQEENYRHNTAEWGNWVYDCLKNQDTESMLRALNTFRDSYNPGRLSSDELRSSKNLVITLITVLAHYAIRDNLIENELALSACDICIIMCEEQTTRENLLKCAYAGLIKLSHLMQEYREREYHPLVLQAKEYVYQHLHDEIKISDIANALGVSPEHLSRSFHKTEKKTLKEFIISERIERSRNLLKYSDFTITEISRYLSFSSQSHFAAAFKRIIGKSPTLYRIDVKE